MTPCVEAFVGKVRGLGLEVEVVMDAPCPILVVMGAAESAYGGDLGSALLILGYELARDVGDKSHADFRAVSFDRLEAILRSGCDVHPTTNVMFVAEPSKALEYGGATKVVEVLDGSKLSSTYVEVSTSTEPERIEELMKTYPTAEQSVDGTRIWLSRLPADDPRRTRPYEVEYARYIPGDPKEALLGVIVVSAEDHVLVDVRRIVATHMNL